ncbi:MAG: hypothetical protein ABSD29_24580 [Verrucomicrobiota bacterium]
MTGTWQPDGRTINPLSAPSAFDPAGTVTFAALAAGIKPLFWRRLRARAFEQIIVTMV